MAGYTLYLTILTTPTPSAGEKGNMKNYKYTIILIVGVLLWVGETAYFGWNMEPLSSQEKVADVISQLVILWGLVGDILANITIQKVSNIKTQNVEVIGGNFIKDDDTHA